MKLSRQSPARRKRLTAPPNPFLPCVAAAVLLCLCGARPARADALNFANTTIIEGSDGAYYNAIGSDMDTTGLRVSSSQQGGSFTLSMNYLTTFSGSATSGSVTAYYADIFLRLPSAGYSAQPFSLAVSLGDQLANGGIAAGLYTPTGIATSADVWSGRIGYVYGAAYGASATSPMYGAPTVLTAGELVGGSAVTVTQTNTGRQLDGQPLYRLSVNISGLSFALAEMLDNGFDAFWGTADCANGAFLAGFDPDRNDPLFKVPEPGTALLFGVWGFVLLRCKRLYLPDRS